METLASYLAVIAQGMDIPIEIYGFTFSFMDLFLFGLFGGIVAGFVGRLLDMFA